MIRHKINLSFNTFSVHRFQVAATIKKCISAALDAENVPVACEINVLVTGDDEIRAINLAGRQIDKATDVLSFPMFTMDTEDTQRDWSALLDPETNLCPLGDMAISMERAQSQAKSFGHSMRREVGYLTIHSVLHLLGYDHLDEGPQKALMRQREEYIASSIPGMQR